MGTSCTEEQRKAIEAKTTVPLAIIACPGSGKTFTILHRVIYLLEHGYKTSNLLVITFTRKAAGELRERLQQLGFSTKDLTVLTFHAFGLRILRRFGQLIGRENFRIISQSEQSKILGEIVGDAASIPGFMSQIQQKLSLYKAGQPLSPAAESSEASQENDAELARRFQLYEKTMATMGCVDYTDLITLPLSLFERFPETLLYYQRMYSYGLVDEVQDVSKVQFELMCRLFGDRGCLTVVGDDDQTIYSWRGADASLLLNFEGRYPGAQVVTLTRCFRCAPPIVAACRRVIANNSDRVKKTINALPKNTDQTIPTPKIPDPQIPNSKISNRQISKVKTSNQQISKAESSNQKISDSQMENAKMAFQKSAEGRKRSFRRAAVKVIGARGVADEARLVVEEMRRIKDGKSVGVLYRRRRDAEEVKRALEAAGMAINVADTVGVADSVTLRSAVQILQMVARKPYDRGVVSIQTLSRVLVETEKLPKFITNSDSDLDDFDFGLLDPNAAKILENPQNSEIPTTSEKVCPKFSGNANQKFSEQKGQNGIFSSQLVLDVGPEKEARVSFETSFLAVKAEETEKKKQKMVFLDDSDDEPEMVDKNTSFLEEEAQSISTMDEAFGIDADFYKKSSKELANPRSSEQELVLREDGERGQIEDNIRSALEHRGCAEVVNLIISALNLGNCSDALLLRAEAEREPTLPLSDFADTVLLLRGEELLNCSPIIGNIRLSTVHQAKGLEWDHVFVVGVTQGLWPSSNTGQKRLPEERRLFYVAMSRARETLTISFHCNPGPSLFISELPEAGVEWVESDLDEDPQNQQNQKNQLNPRGFGYGKNENQATVSFEKKYPGLSLKFESASQKIDRTLFTTASKLKKFPESQ